MLEKLDVLTDDEKQQLMDAVPAITLLIAGADGKIEGEELAMSEKITNIRGYNEDEDLNEFYAKVNEDYRERLNRWLNVLPKNTAERNEDLSKRLSMLNDILAKLDKETGAAFYKSFTSLAKHVAKASGGILGWSSVNKEEAKWMELPMLNPIEVEE